MKFVLLGPPEEVGDPSRSPGVHFRMPWVVSGRGRSALPIPMQVQDDNQATEVFECLQPVVTDLWNHQPRRWSTKAQLADCIMSTSEFEYINNIFAGLPAYTVLLGHRIGVYLDEQAAIDSVENASEVRFRKMIAFQNFCSAFRAMVTNDENTPDTDVLPRPPSGKLLPAPSPSYIRQATPATSPNGTPNRPRQIDHSYSSPARLGLAGGYDQESSGAFRAGAPRTEPRIHLANYGETSQREPKSEPKSYTIRPQQYDEPESPLKGKGKRLATAHPAPRAAANAGASGSGTARLPTRPTANNDGTLRIPFRTLRSLHGVENYQFTNAPAPSSACNAGIRANAYFAAHGYTAEAVRQIIRSYDQSGGNAETFLGSIEAIRVKEAKSKGHAHLSDGPSVAELIYIFELLEEDRGRDADASDGFYAISSGEE